MSNISMALVDEHFLHGQVAELWCTKVQSNLIIVINDNLATNKMQQGLLDMAVPDDIACRYYSVDMAIKKMDLLKEKKSVLYIVETLGDLEKLISLGFEIPKITIASVPASSGSRTIAPRVSLNNSQIDWLNSLKESGVDVQIRQTPQDEEVKI